VLLMKSVPALTIGSRKKSVTLAKRMICIVEAGIVGMAVTSN
jgi:hypothetical protein